MSVPVVSACALHMTVPPSLHHILGLLNLCTLKHFPILHSARLGTWITYTSLLGWTVSFPNC